MATPAVVHVHGGYVNKLHNWIQESEHGLVTDITWPESSTGKDSDIEWTVICVVKGERQGTGTARTKKLAKDIAAKEALINLRGPEPEAVAQAA